MKELLETKINVTKFWFDFDDIVRDRFKGIAEYEGKEYTFYGCCIISENAVKFFDPIREIVGIQTIKMFSEYMNDPDKTFRLWIESVIQSGEYGKGKAPFDSVNEFYNWLGEINATKEVF